MQKITLLCVGKLKEKFYAEAAAEYVKRLRRYCDLTILELPEERAAGESLPGPDRRGPFEGGRSHPGEAAPLLQRHRAVH